MKMKKLTLILAVAVMGFVMASCGGSPKDAIMKDVDEYFSQAEQELAEITNAEDFLQFAEVMSDRSDLIDLLDKKYGDKEISEEDNEIVQNYIYDRATAYNHAEAEKCAEYLTPLVDSFEAAVNQLYAQFQANQVYAADNIDVFIDSFAALLDFSDYDNILPEIQERLDVVLSKVDEMDETLDARIDELYPDEE